MFVVVADSRREKSLMDNMPAEIEANTEVIPSLPPSATEVVEAERKRAALAEFSSSRRALVRFFFYTGQVAGSLLNLADNTFSDFPAERARELREAVSSQDILVGLDPQADCERLGIETGARFIELIPPFMSRKVTKAGRIIRFDDLSAQLA
ncbi:MAG: hypothetical protein KF760_27000 [Candidatus Eremiobacteraeota bacterium]|nr:hypothetical protein [Candidatus Eremiobacteraeota bacterium]MCW5869611.1 hypothetical protein [Candidatus Eremiobacteraeota bacterium]